MGNVRLWAGRPMARKRRRPMRVRSVFIHMLVNLIAILSRCSAPAIPFGEASKRGSC
jgi:hypothetical protein